MYRSLRITLLGVQAQPALLDLVNPELLGPLSLFPLLFSLPDLARLFPLCPLCLLLLHLCPVLLGIFHLDAGLQQIIQFIMICLLRSERGALSWGRQNPHTGNMMAATKSGNNRASTGE